MLNPAVAWEFMKETSLVIAPRILLYSDLLSQTLTESE